MKTTNIIFFFFNWIIFFFLFKIKLSEPTKNSIMIIYIYVYDKRYDWGIAFTWSVITRSKYTCVWHIIIVFTLNVGPFLIFIMEKKKCKGIFILPEGLLYAIDIMVVTLIPVMSTVPHFKSVRCRRNTIRIINIIRFTFRFEQD